MGAGHRGCVLDCGTHLWGTRMTGGKPDPMVVKTPFMGYVLGNPGIMDVFLSYPWTPLGSRNTDRALAPKLQVVQGFPQLALGLGEVW